MDIKQARFPFVAGMAFFCGIFTVTSFTKPKEHVDSKPASYYSCDVLDKWMALQIKLMATTAATFNGPFVRIYAYSGVAAYLSVLPGIPEGSSVYFPATALNQLPLLPALQKGASYHWPSSANAALAFMNRMLFVHTSPANKAAIDSLERALNMSFLKEADSLTVERSAAYGEGIAGIVFNWAETDGYRHASNPYQPPVGPGKWVPTPPNFARAVTPYYGNLRTIVEGSTLHAQPPPPPDYSEDPKSPFYKMILGVYEADRHLSEDQKNIVVFWRDINPGVTAPGHWLNILRQVFHKEKKIQLDKAAFLYAYTGMSLNDAWITCWKTRYEYNLLRPVTYIRNVMGHSDWLPLLTTPPHPEYTAGFAAMGGAVCGALAEVFGDPYPLTDSTYMDMGLGSRSFSSFSALAREAADSKFLGGIHYQVSVDEGLKQGWTVAKHIKRLLQRVQTAKK